MSEKKHKLWIYWITLKLCFRNIRFDHLNLGDFVTYQNETWILTQGVSDPYWNIHKITGVEKLIKMHKGKLDQSKVYSASERRENIHKNDFVKQKTIRNLYHDFTTTWRFYSLNWHGIWFRQTKEEVSRSPIKGFYI